MSEIYKINVLNSNNDITKIFVFHGDKEYKQKDYPANAEPIPMFIYGDDTILRIKEKIFMECGNKIKNPTTSGMYLFSITKKKLNNNNTFFNLTQKETVDLTYNRLRQFLFNIVNNKHSIKKQKIDTFFKKFDVKKDNYEYNDFDELKINWDENLFLTESIGQKIVIKNNYPFIANPYNNNIIDALLKREVQNIISTQNAYLLFKYFPIEDNNIYVCLAENVLNYAEKEKLDQQYFLKLYFPILFKTIKSKEQLLTEKVSLYNTEKTKIKKYYKNINEKIDLFYKISNTTKMDYVTKGISSLHMTLYPENVIKLPLEILFKIIHSTSQIPLIKYNPGSNYENIYRLFTDNNISVSGIKVPTLFILNNSKKTKILNISKTLSKYQSVGFYIEYTFKRTIIEIFCEFFENGSIDIKFESEILLEKKDVNEIIKKTINDNILNIVRNYLKQSGYEYITFTNLKTSNVEINSIKYEFKLKNKKKMNISKYIGCISAIFNIIEGKAAKTTDVIELVYKRVNVFQVMDSINSFITLRDRKGDSDDDMINLLIENFPKEIPTRDKAVNIIGDWYQEMQMKIDIYGDKKRIVESNPGFETKLKSVIYNDGQYLVITMDNINNIQYLEYISIYINSLLKLILKSPSTSKFKTEIDKICSKKLKKQDEIDQVKDIKAMTEQSGPVRFGETANVILELETDSEDDDDEDEELSTDSDEDNDEDSDEDSDEEDETAVIAIPEKSVTVPEISPKQVITKIPDIATDLPTKQDDTPSPKTIPRQLEEKDDSPSPLSPKNSPIIQEGEEDDSPLPLLSSPESDEDSILSSESDEDSILSTSDEDSILSANDDDKMEGGNGGSDSDEEDMEIDVAGEALSGAKSIFARRLKSRDPNLFLKKDTPGYHSYSRACPGQYRRQPMILTDNEKKWIDEKDKESNSKSYDESVRYGSEEDGPKYNYICPRFWCIRDDTGKPRSLSVKQVNDGECGGWDALVPEGAKKVPKGKRIVEFTDERFHRENSKIPKGHPARKIVYRPMYPGFQDKTKHPDGLCIPCCFQSPFGNGNVEEGAAIPNTYKKPAGSVWPVKELYESEEYMNKDGTVNFEKLKEEKYNKFKQLKYSATDLPVGCDQKEGREEESKTSKENINDTPIMSFPLKENQTGYMNLSLQRFLGFNNSKICYTKQSADEKKLKLQSYCIVRLGIDKNKKQSFLHLLGNVYNFYGKRIVHIPPISGKENPKILNIKDFKKIFIEKLTIDAFITAQNGILPQLFDNENIETNDIDNYKKSKYFKKITNIDFKKKIIRAFKNFRNYILNDDEKIDYRYIWDLVCKSESEGGILFKDGINLLIFKNPNDDITSKIEIICPTNHYSAEYFNKKKPTLMVYCKGDYFEPLCKIRRMPGHIEITKFFRDSEFKVFKSNTNIMSIINNIKKSLLQNCMSKKSLKKNIYDYERNILSTELIKELRKIGFSEINIIQLVNYNNKVIGLEIKNENGLYIPCLPSSINFKFAFKLVHELKYNKYKFTRDKLIEIYNKSNKKIPCMPKSKLIDDDAMIVGIKTITNQIIPVEPVAKTEELDDFEETMTYIGKKTSSLMNDENMLINREIDDQRLKVVKEIQLENNFYKLFRNTFKIIINYKIKIKEKMKLLKLIDDSTVTYIEKLERITEELEELLGEAVEFIEFDIDGLEDYEDLITCLGLDKTNCDKTTHCFMRRGTCKLSLPSKNLYSKNDNNVLYYKKLADEIIRYSKIRKYIFTPKEFLSFEHVNYRINNKEIILLEEILFDNYLEDIKLREDNKYIKSTNIYDITQPTGDIINYSSSIDLSSLKEQSKIIKNSEKIDCIDKTVKKYTKNNTTNFLKKLVKDDVKLDLTVEQYMQTGDCCFKAIQIIIQDWHKKKISITDIKNKLIEEYIKLDMIPTTLILEKQNVSTWTVFSLINFLAGRKIVARNVIQKAEGRKNTEIEKQIIQPTYMPTDFDFFLLFKVYKVPVIITMEGKNATSINPNVKILNTSLDSDKEVYVVVVKHKIKTAIGIVKYGTVYKIPKSIINTTINSGEKDINKYITDSLKFQEEKKKKRLESDRKTQQRKRKIQGKIQGKIKLPSK